MKLRNKKGQSTLEYIILVTAVIAVAIVFLQPSKGGKLYDTIESSQNKVAQAIVTKAGNLTTAWGLWH